MSLVLRPLGLSLAGLGLSFACATAQDDPFLQGTGGRIDTAGTGGGGATAGTAGQTGKGGTSGKGGTGGTSGATGKGGTGGTSTAGTGGGGTDGGGGDPGSSGADAGGMGGAPGPDPCAPEGTPPDLHVLVWDRSTNATDDPKGVFRLVNDTDEEVPLSELSFRYYFTSEFDCDDTLPKTAVNVSHVQLDVPYAAVAQSVVTTSVVQLEERGRYCDVYFEIGFTDAAPSLEPEQLVVVDLWTMVEIHNGILHDRTNDFSFGACSTKPAWWDRVTVYRDGVRVSGTGPDNDSGEGGAGGQGGEGGLGGGGGVGGDAAGNGGQGGLGGSAGTGEGGEGGEGGVPSEGGAAGESAGGGGGAL